MHQWDICIKEFKNYKHKKIMVNGRVMTTYLKIPKSISFSSSMVNDMNQNLCGSWFIFDTGIEANEELLNRIINKEKPFGAIAYLKSNDTKYSKFINTIKENNLP